MLTYEEAQKKFDRCRNKDKGYVLHGRATHLIKNGDSFGVKYHNTVVVTIHPDHTYTLNSDGYRTPTTKRKIEEYSPASIYQKNWIWYIYDSGKRFEFFDGIRFNLDGIILNPPDVDKVTEIQEKNKKLDKLITKYVKGFKELVDSGNLEYPSGGDCWYCSMQTQEGVSMGDAFEDNNHIVSHFEEEYYVPSLLYNAIKLRHPQNPEFIYQYLMMDNLDGDRARQILRYYFNQKRNSLLKYM